MSKEVSLIHSPLIEAFEVFVEHIVNSF